MLLALLQSSVAYHVVWQPHPEHLTQPLPLWPLLPIIVLAILILRRPRPLVAAAYVAFAVVWAVAFHKMRHGWNAAVTSAYARTARIAADPSTPVVEGRISHFHPEPEEGHDNERFVIDSVHFEYSYYDVTGCFNRSRSHGGPFREGLQVRLHYVPSTQCIVEVEVADSGMAESH